MKKILFCVSVLFSCSIIVAAAKQTFVPFTSHENAMLSSADASFKEIRNLEAVEDLTLRKKLFELIIAQAEARKALDSFEAKFTRLYGIKFPEYRTPTPPDSPLPPIYKAPTLEDFTLDEPITPCVITDHRSLSSPSSAPSDRSTSPLMKPYVPSPPATPKYAPEPTHTSLSSTAPIVPLSIDELIKQTSPEGRETVCRLTHCSSPLQTLARSTGDDEILSDVETMIDHGQDDQRNTPLLFLCGAGDAKSVIAFLNDPAHESAIDVVNACNNIGITPLMAVCMKSDKPSERLAIAKELIARRAEVNTTDSYGNNAYSFAYAQQLTDICTELIKAGAFEKDLHFEREESKEERIER
jgi:hypothetical protein